MVLVTPTESIATGPLPMILNSSFFDYSLYNTIQFRLNSDSIQIQQVQFRFNSDSIQIQFGFSSDSDSIYFRSPYAHFRGY
ncbi:hypothetical protein VN97_g6085 [Penicillium thymicola]|uniref:Uncharacterized protein n=1 Tax=Penicillium thymicola TaxID=293382 RepID=A0AAI9TH46_PENTH|nr:hypothetical protein VN97_g6085 [Penicillium thymicola]